MKGISRIIGTVVQATGKLVGSDALGSRIDMKPFRTGMRIMIVSSHLHGTNNKMLERPSNKKQKRVTRKYTCHKIRVKTNRRGSAYEHREAAKNMSHGK